MMGPMRSNKTAELQRRADMRRQYAKQYVMVLKPSDDTKGGPGVVESRNPNGGGKMSAVEFRAADPWEVLGAIRETEQKIGKRVECIAIDEGQFVDQLFLFVKHLLEAGHDVHGLLQLRSASPLLAAADRRQARGLRLPHQSSRRLLRAALRRALRSPGPPALTAAAHPSHALTLGMAW